MSAETITTTVLGMNRCLTLNFDNFIIMEFVMQKIFSLNNYCGFNRLLVLLLGSEYSELCIHLDVTFATTSSLLTTSQNTVYTVFQEI